MVLIWLKTYLTVDICSDQIHGSADVEFLETDKKGEYKLQIAIIENLQIKQDAFSEDSTATDSNSLLCGRWARNSFRCVSRSNITDFQVKRKNRKHHRKRTIWQKNS